MSNSSKNSSIPTAAEFDREIKNLIYLFQDKESDTTWESFDKGLKNLNSWARLGAYEYESFVPAIKALKTPIVNSLLTERTRLSGTASELTESLAFVLGRNFEHLSDLFMPALIKLCGRTNKIMVTRALRAVLAIITQSRIPRAVLKFCEPIIQGDPNKGLRSAMAECLLTSLKVNDTRELEPLIENIEKVIKSGAMDPAPEVREIIRKVYEVYKNKFEERVGSFVETLSTDEKKYLKISGASKPAARRPLPLRRQTSQQNMANTQDELSQSESDRSNSSLAGGKAARVRTVSQENVGPISAPTAPVQPPRPSSSASRRPVPSASEFSRALSNLENNTHSRSNTSNGTTDDPTPNSSETHSIDDPADSHSAASSVDDLATETAALKAKHRANVQSVNATMAQRAARQQQQAFPPIDTAATATTTTDTASVASTPSSRRLLTNMSSARKLEGGAILFGPNLSESRPPALNLFPSAPSFGGSASTNVNTSTTTDYIDETASESSRNSDPGQNSNGLPTVNGRPVAHAMRVKAPIVATGAAVGGLLGRPARPIIKAQKAPASGASGTVAPSIPSRSATAGGAQRVIRRTPTVTEKSADTSLDRPASAPTRHPHPHALASTKARSVTAPLPALVEKKSKDVIAAVEKRRKDAADKKELDGDQHSENHKPKVTVERTTSNRRTVSSQPAITRKSSQPALDTGKRSVAAPVQRPTATTSRKATATTSTVNNPSTTSTNARPATSRSSGITKSRSALPLVPKKSTVAGSGSKKASSAATVAAPAESLSPTDPIVTSESTSEQLVDLDTETISVDENVVESIAVASEQVTDDEAVDQPESADESPLLAGEQADAHFGEFEYVNRVGAGPTVVAIGGSN